MKSLHKKIGAMVLAGMVVLGGVAACGVNSFAASSNKVNNKVSKNLGQKMDLQRVQFFSKDYGQIISIEGKMNKSDRSISVYKYNKKDCYNRGKNVVVKNPSEIPLHLQKAKQCKNKFARVEYHSVVCLIKLN